MNLLFDIDNTITKETEFAIKYAPKYLRKKFGQDFTVINLNGYDVSEIFDLKSYLEQNYLSPENLEEDLKKINAGFWNKYFVKYMFYPIKKDASKVMKTLKKEGNNIYFASLRGKKNHDNENLFQKMIRTKIVPFLTKLQLKINHIPYDKLILVEKNEDKVKIAESLQASFIFDDQLEVLEKISNNITPILVEAPHNAHITITDNRICRISFCWENISSIIKEQHRSKNNYGSSISKNKKKKKKIKNLKIYQKLYTETFYKIVREIGKEYVIEHYNPIIFGENNLPQEKKATVFVCNHRNIKDPLIMISLLKNPTHFAALQRMFEYDENMFGPVGKNAGTVFTTILVRSMGCLPIARVTDKNYQLTNLQTFKYIDDYLKMDSSIAIYPEGTLNRNPNKNGNILPLKSNRSFKIAELGKAIVIPTSIVWIPDELGIKNKVVVSFLKPIYTNNLKANEIFMKWETDMNSSISSINKMIETMEEITNDTKDREKVKVI